MWFYKSKDGSKAIPRLLTDVPDVKAGFAESDPAHPRQLLGSI